MKKIREYLLSEVGELRYVVEEINAWDGSLDWLEVYENDEEFFEMFFSNNPMEAVRSAYYGNYNYTDDLVKFNGYGNLESFNRWEYEEELRDYIDDIIERLLSVYYEVDIEEELVELIEEYLEEDEEEE